MERLRRVMELAAQLERAAREGDPLVALRASAEVIEQIYSMQEIWVDAARAKNAKDVEIAAALRVTSPRVAQRFGNRSETARRLREQLDAVLRQEDVE
jgi:hypothetical protein